MIAGAMANDQAIGFSLRKLGADIVEQHRRVVRFEGGRHVAPHGLVASKPVGETMALAAASDVHVVPIDRRQMVLRAPGQLGLSHCQAIRRRTPIAGRCGERVSLSPGPQSVHAGPAPIQRRETLVPKTSPTAARAAEKAPTKAPPPGSGPASQVAIGVGDELHQVGSFGTSRSLYDGTKLAADHQLAGGPCVLFDTVVLIVSDAGVQALLGEAAAVAWAHDAFAHLKVIGHAPAAQPLLDAAGVIPDAGVVSLAKAASVSSYIDAAAGGRIWDREPNVRTVF